MENRRKATVKGNHPPVKRKRRFQDKEDSPGSQVVERARETEALHRLFDAMRVYDAVKSPSNTSTFM